MSYERGAEPVAELQWVEDSVELLASVALRSAVTIAAGVFTLCAALCRRS